MKKMIAWILAAALAMPVFGAAAEGGAPDYLLEGYDGDSVNRNWENNLFFERMQEKTGISFQFRQYSDWDEWTRRKAEILEGTDLPDVLFKAELTGEEVRDLYERGLLIDLRPYLEEYAPDLWKLLQEDPERMLTVSQADGAIAALPCINPMKTTDALWINTEWLERLNLEAPTDSERFAETLRAFRTGDPNRNGKADEVPLTFVGMWELRYLAHAFGITDNDDYVTARDGKVTSSLTTDENRAFLTWLHGLWEEGLLDPNGFSGTDQMRSITDEKAESPYGVLLSTTPMTIMPAGAAEKYQILTPLEWNGERSYRSLTGDTTGGTFALTRECQDPERMVAWVNDLYTEEGSRMALYGQEGEDYFFEEDGSWDWMDDGETVAQDVLPNRTISGGGTAPGWMNPAFQEHYRDSRVRSTLEQLNRLQEYLKLPYPAVTLSREYAQRIREIQPALSRYAETEMARFVTGDRALTDENWAAFREKAESLGLTEMIEILQAGLRTEK